MTVDVKETTTENLSYSFPELNSLDRCDRCGAQAWVRVVMSNKHSLSFCGHHWNKHMDKIKETAVYIQDDSDKLTNSVANYQKF